jgi:uncharacterized RDD family membrane protein YckC
MAGWWGAPVQSTPGGRPWESAGPGRSASVAGLGRRAGAWLLDGVLSGFLVAIPVVAGFLTDVVALNPEALRQFEASTSLRPFDDVTVPLFMVNGGLLWLLAAGWVAVSACYYVGSWLAWGATPAQRLFGLRVLDVEHGRRLSIDAAVLRWALLVGVASTLGAATMALSLQDAARVPANELLGTAALASATAGLSDNVLAISAVGTWGGLVWSLALLVSAATHPLKRALHDRIVGSIVVRLAPVPAWPAFAGYPPAPCPGAPLPGYPPQPGLPPQPGYPPQPWRGQDERPEPRDTGDTPRE